MFRSRKFVLGALVAALALLWQPVSSLGDLHHDIATQQQTAAQLRAAIAAESHALAQTNAGLQEARARLATLQQQVVKRQTQLAAVRRQIVLARDRLTQLENRLHEAALTLAANLRAAYEDPQPDVVTIVLNSNGFADALERLNYMARVQQRNGQILADTKTAKAQVLVQTERLAKLLVRVRALTAQVVEARNGAAVIQGALIARQAAQLTRRANTAARLSRVRGRISSLEHQLAQISRQTTQAAGHPVGGLQLDPGGMAQAPANAPSAVKEVIAAGNAIAGLPYLYGGGHGSFHANAYDCSGSVSYALAAAGLVSSPLDSTAFESWGEPGPGRWITVYANAGHAFMFVAGWRFDTGALAADGTRWSRSLRSTAGFVARHPAGL
jgi:peptidoglycan hydrolase CwlO-like protein